MPLKLKRQPDGKIMPMVEGRYCSACGHEIPGTANSPPELHFVPGKEGETVAYHRPDLIYFTQLVYDPDTKRLKPEHLVTLHIIEDHWPHIIPLIGHFLRDKARTEAGRAELAQYGIGVVSTHDDPTEAPGYQATKEQILDLLARQP